MELDPARQTVRFRKPGVRINLASLGKGYALDVCAERLLALGMTDFLLHGGQSSVLAKGFPTTSGPSKSSRSDMHDWEVGICHPQQPGRRLGVVRLRDRALGTSGGQFQSFRHGGRRYGHILDPRTGWPAEGVLATTVVADTAALADALSTAFFVMGPDQSLDYCRTHPEIGAVLVCVDREGGDITIHTAGLDEEELALAQT